MELEVLLMEAHFETPEAHAILVAEDDDTDFFFLQTAFESEGLPHRLCRAHNGQEVMDLLEGKGAFADRSLWPFPDLLILDLKMPERDGFEVLAALKKSPTLAELPVVILTGSNMASDEKLARGLGASDYHMKPCGIQNLRELILRICERWLKQQHTPQQH